MPRLPEYVLEFYQSWTFKKDELLFIKVFNKLDDLKTFLKNFDETLDAGPDFQSEIKKENLSSEEIIENICEEWTNKYILTYYDKNREFEYFVDEDDDNQNDINFYVIDICFKYNIYA